MPRLALGNTSLAGYSGDTVVVGLRPAESPKGGRRRKDAAPAAQVAAGVELDAALADEIASLVEVLAPKTALGSTTLAAAPAGLRARTLLLVGLGDDAPTTETLRRAAGAATRALPKATSVRLLLPHDGPAQLAAIAEGALSGSYSFTAHKSADAEGGLETVEIGTTLGKEHAPKDVLARAEVLGRAVAWARDLVNTAPNLLYPQSFADRVAETVKASPGKISLTVLDDEDLAKGGFGGIVGVGQGSSRPPRIVQMTYTPSRSRKAPHVGLVGKGITFDTGGVCIKPAASMATMKSDMAGAAAVAATVVAAAELEVPVAVSGYLCLAENMPGGNAQRPGDVVTMRNGMTVEILDTDAEGRMVLADGMSLAAEQGAEVILDIATLTGACMVALGPDIYGVMSNDESVRDAVGVASAATDEPSWPLPLPRDLRPGLDSFVADIAHKADRMGGALTAGIFLEEFARTKDGETIPWAHLDIAGPSFRDGGARDHLPKGGTGVGVATMLRYLEDLA
ncbi:leucyl aminopeptidase [Janibacter sp. UYMM211]|uniref:leucyl aminopeptidase n=1 Tax=Janibacter sp. UYMM211 TaxID=3156342 RepID=UPI0033916F0D